MLPKHPQKTKLNRNQKNMPRKEQILKRITRVNN